MLSSSDPSLDALLGRRVDPAPARRPQRTTLAGRYVSIVPLDAIRHAEALYTGSHGPEKESLWRHLFDGPYPDRSAFDAALQRKAASSDPLFFAILNRAGRAIGCASYLRIEFWHRVVEVGNILYTPALQRTPGGTEAMFLMARHAFEDLGYRRYEWKCNALNLPSRRAALRLGFSFEGIFRNHMIVKDRSRDTAWFAMVEEEWPLCRTAFERWLDPANFDENGRQIASLTTLRRIASGDSYPAIPDRST